MGTIALNAKATRTSISPKDNHVVAVTGDRLLKLLRVQENTFKYLADISNVNSTHIHGVIILDQYEPKVHRACLG